MYKCCDCEQEFEIPDDEYIEDDIPYNIEICPFCGSEHFKMVISSK